MVQWTRVVVHEIRASEKLCPGVQQNLFQDAYVPDFSCTDIAYEKSDFPTVAETIHMYAGQPSPNQ